MGVLSLNVVSSEKGIKKTMQFEPATLVFDAAKLIRDKFAMHDTNPSEYGLFRIEDEPSKCVWMENGRTLEYYLVRNQDKIEYKKKIRLLKVRMLDGAVKTISVDESQPVSQLMLTICNKIGIANYEEYSLVRDDVLLSGSNNNSTWNLRDDRSRSVERSGMMGTLGRKKEQKLEELRKKLHTDEELPWLDHSKTLREQNISEEETLLLRRKFFFSDTNVDSRDPVQLNLLYVQCRDGILRGLHPVQKETALHLAALQAHIEYGDFPYDKPKFHIDGRDVLPKEYGKVKENEKKLVQLYKELSGTAELDAKSKYVHLCRELKTYGVTFFVVKEKMAGKNKLVPRLLGVNKESVMRVDEKTKQILKEWPLEQVRRWASSGKTFNLDFGDYQDGYYSVQTSDGEKIGQLIGGYIDIILKKKRTRDHQGIEGDEGSTMLEDMVAPAKATLVAHGQIGANGHNVTDGSVAVKGVLRTPQGGYGYGINGAQYGAVSGEITSQTLAKAQRLRIRDMYEHPQRALIGTIEATIRAVDEAEIELDAEPQIDIPKFNDDLSANRWVDEQMAVNKENVNERLAAMGAATAQVVQWTAVQEEYDDRVGTAIATIGSNLPDVSRNVRDLSALMSRDERGDLVEATRLLCGAFGDFLTAVNPEQNERRNVVFTAAGRVGEFSQQVINTMDQPSESQKFFDDHLVQKAKNVATSTAQLVMCAKTISAECDEPEVQEKVIQSATKCAFATSQLVACARVVAPTIDNSACQQQLTTAATEVSQSVSNLLHDSQYAVHEQSRLTDIHTAARQVTNALDSLLEHAKTSPKITNHREEEEEYNAVLRTTNRMIAHQGPSEELTREAKRVVRHSQILQEQFEHEAHQRPEDRDRLLDAARRVATATSDMIAATKECESRPAEVESERALRSAAERLGRVTNETTQEQQEKHIMQRLEQAAKQTAYDATQTIAASNASKDVISNKSYSNNLVYESTCTAEHLPRLITSIRESQNATTDSQKFRAQSRLIRDSHQVLETSVRLVETSRSAIPSVTEVHLASNLSESSNRLATSLAELRTAVNDAQQLNFSQQLVYSEELIRELDEQLINTQRAAIAHQLTPPPSATPLSTTSHLMSTSRHVGSGVAQLISAASLKDEKHVGASAVELAQYLRDFTNAVTEVVSTRTDVQLEKFIVSARSVVNETGRVFDRVRQMSPPVVLADTAKNVSTSLKQVIACIPDTEHIDKAIYKIQTASASSGTIVAASSLRQAADRLIDATSQIVVTLGAADNMKAVDVFVEAYCDLHASVIANIRNQGDQQIRQKLVERLEHTQREAISVLGTLSRASVLSDATTSQQLTTETRQLTSTVNRLVEDIQDGVETPWEKECDAALRRIQSVYHVTQHAALPVNDHGFFESLQKVSEVSHQLGEAMTGMARHAKVNDANGFCQNVRNSADALCSLAEYASHSAYLVGIAHPASTPGRAPLIDASNVSRNVESVTSSCSRIESCQLNRDELLNETASVAKNTANLAQMCRNASEQTSNVSVKKHMVNSALELASKTANLVNSVKTLDSQRLPDAEEQCVHSCVELRHVAQQLLQFADNPDFAAIQANISNEGRYSQQPILQSSRQMLDTSAEMIKTAKRLATSPQEAVTWQRLADNSIQVSESIKRLVASIHEAAPGQIELERAIARLHSLSGYVENAAMDAYAMASDSQHSASAEKQLLQQVQHITHSLEDRVDELRSAAVAHGERLPHIVEQHCQLVEDMANAACAAASMAVDSNKQTELFDKCRTVVEAELQLMIACQESGGNPNAKHAHRHVDDAAAQLKHVIGDMRALIAKVSTEREAVQGMVDTISSSIVHTDTASGPGSTAGSFADSQTRMTDNLEEIRRTAQHMQRCDANSLGPASLNLSEKYRLVAADVRGAVGMLPEADIGQKLKVAVQKLGTGCIETVKTAGQRRAHPEDERIHRELTTQTTTVVERVDQVLAALHEASRGTQACINAANTVSGIIGDLDTTIMFATSGSLNSADDQQRFLSHRDAILKTARALIEDTKALVAGAASNQEQLAVAAQNAVRTIVNLSDAVKNGAVSLSSDNSESQVLVIHAVRDVAAALSSLIQATKNASGKQLKDPAMEQLKEATKVMFSNVTSLLNTVKSVEDREHQGTIVLRAAVKAVTSEIEHYLANPPQEPSASNVQTELHPEHLQSAADNITQITRRIASNATADNLQTQEELSMVANMSRTAVRSLLAVVREVCNEIDDAKLRYQVFEGGRDVANNIKSLLDTLHTQMTTNIGHDESKSLLLEASRSVADALNRLIGACSEVSYATNGRDDAHHDAAAAHAENELLGAASSIEAASLRLAELRPRQSIVQNEQEQPEEIEFDGQILSAAKSITSAVQTLVRAASNAQRELIAQGRLDTSRSSGPDYQWSEGLVSAARFVVAAVHQLCEAANGLVQGHASEEKLISAAKQVASSTAHLLVACNVKADMDSQAKRRLQIAGQAVKNATERLVQSARQIVSRDDRNIVISERLVSGIAQVMDAQEEVLRKEKELGEARHRLAHLNKARYERTGEE